MKILIENGKLLEELIVFTPPENDLFNNYNSITSNIPIKRFADSLNIPNNQVPRSTLKGWNVPFPLDLALVVSFGYFIPPRIINHFSHGTLNIHPSLLPRHRGPSPVEFTILNNDQETGVSIIDLHPKIMDAGNIFKQSTVKIPPNCFAHQLRKDLSLLGAKDLIEVLENYDDYKKLAISQPLESNLITKTTKITKEMAEIDLINHTIHEIYTKYRALSHFVNLYIKFLGKPLFLFNLLDPNSIQPINLTKDVSPGTVTFDPKSDLMFLRAKDGFIGVQQVQFPGLKRLNGREFYHGRRPHVATLWTKKRKL